MTGSDLRRHLQVGSRKTKLGMLSPVPSSSTVEVTSARNTVYLERADAALGEQGLPSMTGTPPQGYLEASKALRSLKCKEARIAQIVWGGKRVHSSQFLLEPPAGAADSSCAMS